MTYGTGSSLPPGTDGTTSLCHNDRFVKDGYCDDSTNTELCNFDGGDSCYKKSNYQYCNDCICYPGAPEITGIAKRINILFLLSNSMSFILDKTTIAPVTQKTTTSPPEECINCNSSSQVKLHMFNLFLILMKLYF